MRLPPPAIPGRIFALSIQGAAASASGIVRLAGVLDAHRIAACWGVATAADADVVQAAVRKGSTHELALDCSAKSHADPRRTLAANLRNLRSSGFEIASVICLDRPATGDLESLSRLGVRIVVMAGESADSTLATTLRFGLWRLATSWRLPGDGWLGDAWGAARGKRMLDAAIRRNAPFHVMLDAAAMEASTSAVRGLERLLKHVDKRRQQGALSVVTLAGIAQRLTPRRTSATAHSILRERAA
jgi:hypothetical protein